MVNRRSAPKKRGSGWLIAAVLIAPVILGTLLARWSPVAIVLALVAVIGIGLFVLIARPLPAVGLRTRASGFVALGLAALLATGGGVASASSTRSDDVTASTPHTLVGGSADAVTPRPSVKPTTFDTATEEVAIPYEQTTVDDPARDQGTTAIVTAGVAGLKVITYKLTLVDGVESHREVVSEVVQTSPVAEVTAVGSRVPQPAAPPAPVPLVQQGSGGCDPNYTGACVPISSDVDCDGGSGDGPAYVRGPVQIVGSDVYDLDRDGDGIACDK